MLGCRYDYVKDTQIFPPAYPPGLEPAWTTRAGPCGGRMIYSWEADACLVDTRKVGPSSRESCVHLVSHGVRGPGIQTQVYWLLCSESQEAEIKVSGACSHLRFRVIFSPLQVGKILHLQN